MRSPPAFDDLAPPVIAPVTAVCSAWRPAEGHPRSTCSAVASWHVVQDHAEALHVLLVVEADRQLLRRERSPGSGLRLPVETPGAAPTQAREAPPCPSLESKTALASARGAPAPRARADSAKSAAIAQATTERRGGSWTDSCPSGSSSEKGRGSRSRAGEIAAPRGEFRVCSNSTPSLVCPDVLEPAAALRRRHVHEARRVARRPEVVLPVVERRTTSPSQ